MSAEPIPNPPRLGELRRLRSTVEPHAATAIGQLPAKVDLTIYQGDDIHVHVTVSGTIDLTGYTPQAEIRSAPGGALIATFVATIADPVTVALHLPHDQSAKLVSNAAWDVQIADSAGEITTLAYGAVTAVKQVTP